MGGCWHRLNHTLFSWPPFEWGWLPHDCLVGPSVKLVETLALPLRQCSFQTLGETLALPTWHSFTQQRLHPSHSLKHYGHLLMYSIFGNLAESWLTAVLPHPLVPLMCQNCNWYMNMSTACRLVWVSNVFGQTRYCPSHGENNNATSVDNNYYYNNYYIPLESVPVAVEADQSDFLSDVLGNVTLFSAWERYPAL